jgi:all-trans-retinol 13,14-reductase
MTEPTEQASTSSSGRSDEHRRAHAPIPEEVDVAIIGSGLGGLVAGAYLARSGLRVACFESHYVAGGCATEFVRGKKSARYRFDVGLHYIGDCGFDGPIPRILRDLGTSLELVPMDPTGFDTLVYPDFTFRIPADVELYRSRLLDFFPEERRGIDRYLSVLRAVMKASRVLEDGKPTLRGALALAPNALALARFSKATIGQVCDWATKNPRLKAVFLGQSGDYGLPPSRASAMLHLGLAAHYFNGAYYPKGGGQTIADKVASSFEAAGGSLHLRRGVARVLVERGTAAGVELEPRAGVPGPRVRARVVLSNADLLRTLTHLVGLEHLPSEWVSRSAKMQMGGAIFMTFLGIQGHPSQWGMRRTNYWQFDDYDMDAFYALPSPGEPIRAHGCYVTSGSMKDPDSATHHAPPGHATVEVMTLVPAAGPRWHVTPEEAMSWSYRDNDRYRATKQALEDDLVARVEKLFPKMTAAIVHRESATPVTHQRFTRATDGTGYGLAATPEQFLQGRPGYRGPLPGLYFAGASTRSGHGIVGAMLSGQKAARRIASDLGRRV